MSGFENDDYMPDEGHLVSGKVKRIKHIDASPMGRPGQRGKNKREQGEKPPVTVKWSQQLTEQLWTLIKAKPDLKRVLVNEPTRYLGPHGASNSLFSKKDLQKTIAEQLFNDGSYDLSDPTIMENLTRAVKNKLHKTQMLYEASLRDLPPEFKEYQFEHEVPQATRAKWAKVKDRFPTYFEYHELAQEIPAIAKEMEIQAQQFGAWKAKALSGSEDGSPNSFIGGRQRSRSIETSASWDLPDSPPLMSVPDTREQEFEVLPPPADHRTSFSDLEAFPGANTAALGSMAHRLSHSASPIAGPLHLHSPNSFPQDLSGRWSPNHIHSPGGLTPGALGAGVQHVPRSSTDDISATWTPSADHMVPSQLNLESHSYDANPASLQGAGPWSNTASPSLRAGPRYPPASFNNNPSVDGLHLTAQSLVQPGAEGRAGGTQKQHRRGRSDGNRDTTADALRRSLSPQPTSPFSPDYSSTSGSPDMPGSTDSAREDQSLQALLSILQEREKRKRQRDEEWIRLRNKKLEDRERQRIENQRQREENERRRQHETRMSEMALQKLQLENQLRQSELRSSSVTTGSNIASPEALTRGTMGSDASHDMQFMNNMMLYQQTHGGSHDTSYDQQSHPMGIMGLAQNSHSLPPMSLQTQSAQQQQQSRMGMLGMNQFHHSPITHPEMRTDVVPQMSLDTNFHQEKFGDAQLTDMFGANLG